MEAALGPVLAVPWVCLLLPAFLARSRKRYSSLGPSVKQVVLDAERVEHPPDDEVD